MALEYFEPAITDSEEDPEWLEDWTEFIRTLRTQFGPIDPTGDAESGLDHLKMQDNQHLIKYNIEFTGVRNHHHLLQKPRLEPHKPRRKSLPQEIRKKPKQSSSLRTD